MLFWLNCSRLTLSLTLFLTFLKYTAEFKYGARGGRAMACLALACAVLAAALGALCRPRGPIAGLCGPTAPVGHLCKRGTAAGPTLAGWKGADAPRRARRP